MSDKTGAYAAAELGSKLRGEDPGELVRSFAGLVDDKRTLRLLNYYDGLLPPGKSIEETPIGRLIISNAATETMDEAVRHGSVSQMKSATGLTGNDKDGQDLYARAAKELGHEGSIGIVFGSPGAGKTATTIDIAQSWRVRTGGTIIGNTTWEGFDYQIHSDVDMLETMASIDGPVLALLDEIAQRVVRLRFRATKPLRSSLIARCSSGRWKNNTGNTRSAEVCCSSVTRNKTAQKASVGLHRSVSTSQVGQIRGARRFGNSRWQRQVDRGGRLQRIDRHGRNLCRTRGERVRNHHGRRR